MKRNDLHVKLRRFLAFSLSVLMLTQSSGFIRLAEAVYASSEEDMQQMEEVPSPSAEETAGSPAEIAETGPSEETSSGGTSSENEPIPAEIPEASADEATDHGTETVTETSSSEVNETPAPEVNETPAPEVNETPAPEVSETPVPEASETPAPEGTETPAPEGTETSAPEASETPAPEAAETPAPEASETPAPEATETPAPEVSVTPTPEVSETPTPTPEPKTEFHYEDGRVVISASASKAANLPQDAQIHADYMAPGTAAYAQAAAALEAVYGGEGIVLDYVFYDIYFTAESAGGGRIEPEAGTVTVNIQFKTQELKPEEDIEVQSYQVVHVENGSVQNVTNYVNPTGDGSVASAGFTSSDFSPYGIVSIGEDVPVPIANTSPVVLGESGNGTITNVNIRVWTGSGYEDFVEGKKYPRDTTFEFRLSYSFDNTSQKPTVENPEAVYDLPTSLSVEAKNGDIFDEFGSPAGKFEIVGNRIYLHYDKSWLESHSSNIEGYFSFDASVKKEASDNKDRVTFEFKGSSSNPSIEFEGGKVEGHKSHTTNPDGTIDVTVTLDVTGTDVENVQITDTLGSNLEFVEGSFTLDGASIPDLVSGVQSPLLPGKLGVGQHILKYKVRVRDINELNPTSNTINWTWEGDSEPGHEAKDEITFTKKSVTKTGGQDWNNPGTILWTITVTPDQFGTVLGKMITDTLGEGQEFVGNLKVQVDDWKIVSETPIEEYVKNGTLTYTFPADGFPPEYPTGQCIGKTFKIIYSTQVTDPSQSKAYTNDVETNDGDKGKGEVTYYQPQKDPGPGPSTPKILEKTGEYTGQVGGSNTIKWTVTVTPPEGQDVKELVLTDTLENPGYTGSYFLKDSLKGVPGDAVVEWFPDGEKPTEFRITFKSPVTEKLTLTVESKSDSTDKWQKNIVNAVYTDGETKKEEEANANVEFKSVDFSASKEGSLDLRTATWTIYVNKKYEDGVSGDLGNDEYYVKDTLPDGMEYVDGSASCIFKKPYGDKEEYPITPEYDRASNTLTFKFSGVGERYVVLTYKTIITGEIGADTEYTNSAQIGRGSETLGTVTKTVKPELQHLDKTGMLKEGALNQLEYTIHVNTAGEDLDRNSDFLTLSDVLDLNMNLLPGISAVDMRTGDPVVYSMSYELLSDGHGKLTLVLPDSTPVTVTYTVQITGKAGDKVSVSNTATLEGVAGSEVTKKNEVVIQESSAGVSGALDSITVSKVDGSTLEPLENAVFELYRVDYTEPVDWTSGILIATKTTGSNGTAVFDKLQLDQLYYLREKTAPEGYQIDGTKHYFVIAGSDFESAQEKIGDNVDYITYNGGNTIKLSNKRIEKGSLTIRKVFAPADLTDAQKNGITFTLYGPAGEENGGKGKQVGQPVTYKDMAAGSYTYSDLEPGTYTVVESNADLDGYTRVTTYKVDGGQASQSGDSVAVTVGDSGKEVEITNTYVADVPASIPGTKVLTGRDLEANEFTFQLYEGEVKRGEASNAADGSFSFTVGPYSLSDLTKDGSGDYQPRTYTYSVKEVAEPQKHPEITYDPTVFTVNVTVTYDAQNNKLQASAVVQNNENITFTNTFAQTGTAKFEVQKTYTGGTFPEGGFTFELKGENGAPMPASSTLTVNSSDPAWFDEITYTENGEYEYAISEKTDDSDDSEVIYDNTVYHVTVKVEDGPSGTTKKNVTVSYSGDTATDKASFTNRKKGQLKVTKTVKGDLEESKLTDVQKGNIEFAVYGPKKADGKYPDQPIDTFTYAEMIETNGWTSGWLVPGTYLVKETKKELEGFDVDTTWGNDIDTDEIEVEVKEGQEESSLTVVSATNTYTKKKPDTERLKVKKTATGPLPEGKEFTFKLYEYDDGTEKEIDSVAIREGETHFKDLTYETAGTYTYKIKEDIPDPVPAGYTYDDSVYTVTVTVEEKERELQVTSTTYEKDGESQGAPASEAAFTNTYQPKETSITLHAKKNYTDDSDVPLTLSGGEFRFSAVEVTAPNGSGTIVEKGYSSEEASNDAGGNVTFNAITYTEPGVHYYRITELIPEDTEKDASITYDQTVHYVTVTVKDNDGQLVAEADPAVAQPVQFNNKKNKPGSTDLTFSGKKSISGIDSTDEVFTFELYETDSTYDITGKEPMESVSTSGEITQAGKTYSFGKISYSEEKTHYYVVKEKAFDKANGFSTDATIYKFQVDVKIDTGTNMFVAEVTGADVENLDFTNVYKVPEKTSKTVTKIWQDADNQDGKRADSIEVQLMADGSPYGEKVTLNETNRWTHTWSDLPGEASGETITYTVKEITQVPGYETTYSDDTFTITNKHTPETTSRSVTKVWSDAGNQDGIRPASVEVQLYANNEEYGDPVTLSQENGWEHTWTGLPRYKNRAEIDYSVEESAVQDYSAAVTENEQTGSFEITNSYTPGKRTFEVRKVWNDENDQDGLRPAAVSVQLYANGIAHGEPVVLNAENGWSYIWTDLDEKANGVAIDYTVQEVTEVAGYEDPVISDGTITNTHVPETVEKTVTKIWNDNGNENANRPDSIQVQLYANGAPHGEPVSLSGPDWSSTWTNLPKYMNKEEVTYTVQEIGSATGYIASYSDDTFTITNTEETVEKTVTKIWNDNGNENRNRPNSIQVQLYANGASYGEPVSLSEPDWSSTWTNLPKYMNKEEVTYTAQEIGSVTGYLTSYSDDTFTITNTEEITSRSVTKIWSDAGNQDGIRPASVEVQLYANNEEYGDPVTLSQENGWEHTWTGLPRYKNRAEIDYSVEESAVQDYSAAVTENEQTGSFEITNSYTPGKRTFEVRKVWEDENDQDGLRPAAVSVQLYANGTAYGEPVVLNAENSWSYIWTDLDAKANGVDIDYTVQEVTVVDGYEDPVISNGSITNTHVPETVARTVVKEWSGDTASMRPAGIRVTLMADGEVRETVMLNAENGWTYTWPNLPRNANGREIVYTVQEDIVDGYAASYSSDTFTITNTATTVRVDKVDENGSPVIGAGLQIRAGGAAAGSVVDSWVTSAAGAHDVTGKLAVGQSYILEETSAPDGYGLAAPVEFTVNGNGQIVVNGRVQETIVMVDSGIHFNVNKTDFGTGEELEGAEIEVLDRNGNVVDSWTSRKGETHDFGDKLQAGESYTLRERVAPDGYNYATDIPFTVERDGSITVGMPVTRDEAGNETYLVEDSKIHFNVNKTDFETGEEVEGAELEVLDKDGNVVDSWTSRKGETHDFGDKLKAGESYTLRERVAPDGYSYVTDIEFTVERDGTITAGMPVTRDEAGNETYLVEDKKIHFNVNKTDFGTGEEVEGAELEVLDKDGNVVDSWTSKKGETHDFGDKLKAGESYTLREKVAPDGYYYVTDIEFTVETDGTITAGMPVTRDEEGNETYLVEDRKIEVLVSKVDAADGAYLEGAVLQIQDQDGNVLEEWVSTGEPHRVEAELTAGETYVLVEIEAPENYEIADPVEFTLERDGSLAPEVGAAVEVEMQDVRATASLTVTKTLTLNPDGIMMGAVDAVFYVALFEDPELTNRISDVKPLEYHNQASSSVTFADLEVGKTYYVAEVNESGEPEDVGMIVTASGDEIFYSANFAEGNEAVVEDEGGNVTIFFENQFDTIPDGYFLDGRLEVTKILLGADGQAKNSDEVFYAGVFDDPEYTIPSEYAESNLLTLEMNGSSTATAVTPVGIPEEGGSITLYVTEVDETGTPVAGAEGFQYIVSQDVTQVVIQEETLAKVTITNREKAKETPAPTVTPSNTPAPAAQGKTGVQTGDDTPIGTYLALLAASIVLLGAVAIKRRRRNR